MVRQCFPRAFSTPYLICIFHTTPVFFGERSIPWCLAIDKNMFGYLPLLRDPRGPTSRTKLYCTKYRWRSVTCSATWSCCFFNSLNWPRSLGMQIHSSSIKDSGTRITFKETSISLIEYYFQVCHWSVGYCPHLPIDMSHQKRKPNIWFELSYLQQCAGWWFSTIVIIRCMFWVTVLVAGECGSVVESLSFEHLATIQGHKQWIYTDYPNRLVHSSWVVALAERHLPFACIMSRVRAYNEPG